MARWAASVRKALAEGCLARNAVHARGCTLSSSTMAYSSGSRPCAL